MDASAEEHEHASQIIVIPDKDESYYNQLSQKLPEVKCIRTTSPLDKETLWIEIFPKNVSKGHGVAWLCDYTQTDPTKTVGIGNDYNDLDLLDFTTQSFVVANAPDELQQQYSTCNSNTSCGFTDAIMKALDLADQE
jgi:hydroxymethylpyrimidine pyrophosphatase-like HAD family hydrolase